MTVTFIAHSAYLVEWDKFYTLFDYTYEPDYTGELPELNPDKPLLVFASHSHEDHFDAKVFTLLEKYPDARFFVSRDTRLTERKRQWLNISDEAFARTTVLRPDSILLTDVAGEDLSIRAIKSTDIGNAYLLRCEGKMVYHGGDLNWWLVCLGIRPSCTPQRGLKLHHLGRETFLSPVIWNEEGWPVVGNNGRIDLEMEGPLPGNQVQPICRNFTDNFSEEKFSLHYNWVRTPHMENYVRDTAAGQLILKGTSVTLNDMDTPTWVGIKQKEFDVEADVVVSLKENFSDSCLVSQDSNVKGLNKRVGLGTFYNQFYHYEIYLTREDGQYKVCLSRHIHDMFARTAEKVVSSGENIHFRIIGNPLEYDFWYSEDGKYYEKLGSGATAGLATEGTMYMSFTGTYIGMFSENAEGHFRNFSVKINKN